ncbi:MAG: hypothetical protein IKW42_01090 [Alistipes sp.]|nr:hypothetical protein [Alistipes sp.]
MQHDYKNAEHIASIAAIPQIIERSILVESLPNEDIEKHPSITHYDYYVCGLKIGAEAYAVKAVIANMADGTRYYDHKLSSIEKGRLIDIIKQAPETSVSISTQTPESSALSDVKDTRLILILQTNASKIVDENGVPKVVYHGTPNNFNAFSKEMFGTSTDRGIWGNGFYFSDSEQYAKTYEKRGDKQGRTLTVFLNIENPLFISLRNGGNEGAMYFHELMEKHFTDDIYEDATRTDELMSVAQERLSADIVANGYDGIVVEYTNHIDTEYVAFEPNQIKSADPVTYDDNGNVIPLSERFNPEKEDIRYSLAAYNGDIERILSDSKAIAKAYAISSDVIVAKSEQDYITALLAYGVPEDKIYSDTDAVYLDWEDVIVVNAQGINTPIRLTEVLNHENMHSISRQDKESITKVAGALPILKVVEYAGNELGYSLDYIKKHFADIPLEVVDEILSTFVESISTMPVVGGGYVLRRYLMGYLTIEDALEASKQIIKEKYGSKYSELTAATMPLLQDNLIKLRDERYKEGKVGNTTVWSEGSVTNSEGFAETGRSEEESRAESQTAQRDGRTEAGSTGDEDGGVNKLSIIHDMTEEDAYKASLLEEAMRMEREATSNGMDIAQEIADATGWVRLANGEWKYYVVSYSFSTSNHNKENN